MGAIFEIKCRLNPPKNLAPISLWKPHAQIVYFPSLPIFGQPGFAYIYRPPTTENKKFMAKFAHVYFAGINSKERLYRVFNPQVQPVDIFRLSDF